MLFTVQKHYLKSNLDKIILIKSSKNCDCYVYSETPEAWNKEKLEIILLHSL